MVVYPGDSEGPVNCKGFTWSDKEGDLSNLYKGNLLFEVAMRYGLKGNGYTRSVPHAPMCACADQMPVVSKADCTGVDSISHEWTFALDAETNLIQLWQSSINLKFNDCGGKDLAVEYNEVHGKSISRITGKCEAAEDEFLGRKSFKPVVGVQWVKVAGKGSYAEPGGPMYKEQSDDGGHSSYSREDFETVWATSPNQILLRRCKYCTGTHRYVYLRRYDTDGLPANVDLLKMVKDNWKQYDNNKAQEHFKLFSTYDDALKDQNHWTSINSDYYNIGFARDSGPDAFVYNQWNVWETPLQNKHKGQSSVAFYVETKAD
jgi:hypothetical protein